MKSSTPAHCSLQLGSPWPSHIPTSPTREQKLLTETFLIVDKEIKEDDVSMGNENLIPHPSKVMPSPMFAFNGLHKIKE